MKRSLRVKISVAFFVMSLILVLFLSVAANFMLQHRFKQYTIEKIQSDSVSLAEQISKQYSSPENVWDTNSIQAIGVIALERGLILKVVDQDNKVIWDAQEYNRFYCSQMLSTTKMNMMQENSGFSGEYKENSINLTNDGNIFGKVIIGYLGPYYYSENDVKYIKGLNGLLIGGGVLALILSLIAGAYMAKRLSRPIDDVIEGAKKIALGEYDTKVLIKSDTTEIIELTETINSLGDGLDRQETLRKQLSADIAHELRTPVTVLQSHLELMIAGIWKADKASLQNLYNESLRLGNLVDDLGKMAQLEGENLILNKVEFDLNDIAVSVVKTVESEFFKKNIRLSYTGEKTPVHADPDKIKQVMMNLLTNALNYTDAEGNVRVTIKNESGKGSVMVEDDGIGISKENLANVFERFYRVDKSRARHSGGTGIGLAIAKAIIEAHGGEIQAESREGEGSRFTFIL